MKGGKRKKQPINDAPFNEIINQMKSINGKCIPCLIDFEGYSIYHCDTPLQPAKKPQNILARYFNHWQEYIELKKRQHFLDLFAFSQHDTRVLSLCFNNWKTKYIQLSKANIILYFSKWQILYEKNILRSFLISYVGKRAYFAWKEVVHRSKTVGKYQKRQMRKYFLIMKKLYEGSNYRTKQFQKKSLLITSLSTKKIYFKKWVVKARNKQLIIKRERFQNNKLELQTRFTFLRWKKYYYIRLYARNKAKNIMKDAIDFWKSSKEVKQNFLNKMNEIQAFQTQKILHRMMRKWKKKYKIRRNKKRKANIKLWSLVVYHEIIFAQIQHQKQRRVQLSIFAYMKKRTRKSIKEVGKRVLKQWRKITFLQNAEKLVAQNIIKIQCETCFIKWRMQLHQIIDERIINEIRKEVVEKNCILHCFKIWITKSSYIYHHQMKKVKKFRRRHLLIYPFIAWKNIGRLKELRAQHYLRQILLKKYFPAFKMYVNYSMNWKYEQSIQRDNYRIKKKYFNVMKNILEKRGFHYNNNDDDQYIIRLVNRTHNFLCVSRLQYL